MDSESCSERLKAALHVRENKRWLKKLWHLEEESPSLRRDKKKFINRGNKQQRLLLARLLHCVLTGAIPLRGDLVEALTWSRKVSFMSRHFEAKAGFEKLLHGTDLELKHVLARVSHYNVLLANLFEKKIH
jgi:hypothetical protein